MEERIRQLKISTGEKQRLHKRREIVKSMKFIRILGSKLRRELQE